MTTKRQLVTDAFAEIGLADYVFDIPTEQLQFGLRKLDAMMADWNGMGLRLGYAIPGDTGGGDLDTDAGVPDRAWQAIVANLAVRIAPSMGKQLMPETKAAADRGLTMLLGKVLPPEQQYGRIPAGAGNKTWRSQLDPFLVPDTPALEAGPDGNVEFN